MRHQQREATMVTTWHYFKLGRDGQLMDELGYGVTFDYKPLKFASVVEAETFLEEHNIRGSVTLD